VNIESSLGWDISWINYKAGSNYEVINSAQAFTRQYYSTTPSSSLADLPRARRCQGSCSRLRSTIIASNHPFFGLSTSNNSLKNERNYRLSVVFTQICRNDNNSPVSKGLVWLGIMLRIEISGGVSQLETVQHCLSAVRRVWFFMDCILLTLNINNNDNKN